jgi:hypothetical protein
MDSLVRARKILHSLWTSCWLKGRCWGPKLAEGNDRKNPFRGSNITIAVGMELVSISQNPDGSLNIHEFAQVYGTTLGKKIRAMLKEEQIQISNDPKQ